MHGEISRRDLIKAALAASLTAVGTAGCNSSSEETGQGSGDLLPKAAGATKNADGTATVAGGGQLAAGSAMPITLPDQRPALLFKTKSGEVRALSALCTHNQCTVTWDEANQKINCPCHGSVFDLSGKPEKGPAEVPLEKYSVQIKGSDALLQLKS
jgi:Rieske Fe-S protein